MDRRQRWRIAIALILILVGVWLLAVQFVPGLQVFALAENSWPHRFWRALADCSIIKT